MVKYFLAFFVFFVSVLISSESAAQSEMPINEWVLFKKISGVEVYIKHQESPYDMKLNTLVRLRNTNAREVSVSFKPVFRCDTGVNSANNGDVRVNIYPRHSITLLAYRPCKGEMPADMELSNIKIFIK
ncbi:MAG: hypothetical protein EAZ57_08030 [Cytophagales bacterium]|nr:MAG: hypothetical protein EAZ67_09110 [Cytophagales bacterium]TAF60281.1 MAG: hypothetical protein EAZ57_08030 [Cytophagales bacterium]